MRDVYLPFEGNVSKGEWQTPADESCTANVMYTVPDHSRQENVRYIDVGYSKTREQFWLTVFFWKRHRETVGQSNYSNPRCTSVVQDWGISFSRGTVNMT